MTPYDNKNMCCGCTACKSICPKSAIHMVDDEEGFKYPEVDSCKCVNCGLCKHVCDFSSDKSTNNKSEPLAYAAKHINETVRMSSTSGGAFTAISDYILSLSGVIYGAAFDDHFNVRHERAEDAASRDKFKGSKYVQSDMNRIFSEVRTDLNNGRDVLFTGTPCQCAGLKRYLELSHTNIEKLNLCDIVCHGVPSPLMWSEHIKSCEGKKKKKIVSYSCRSKVNGWHCHSEEILYEDDTIDYKSSFSQKEKVLFHSHNILRLSCHICKYTTINRCSDITIADYWGIDKCMPEFDDNKGVSLMLINTVRGSQLFKCISNNLDYKQSNVVDCLQPQLQYPTKASAKRSEFWDDYKRHGYNFIIKKYAGCGIKSKISVMLDRLGLLCLVRKVMRRK